MIGSINVKVVCHTLGLFIMMLSANLVGQPNFKYFGRIQSNTAPEKHNILSVRALQNRVEDMGRITQEVWQDWSVVTSQYENNIQYLYTYGGDHDKLTKSLKQTWENGQWIDSYSYDYFYDANGLVTEYKYKEWDGNNWDHIGTGTYTDYNEYGNYGEETYKEKEGDKFEYRDKYEYNYDNDGNLIAKLSSY